MTSWEPPHGFAWKADDGPLVATGGIRFEPIPEGTRVTTFSDWEMTGFNAPCFTDHALDRPAPVQK